MRPAEFNDEQVIKAGTKLEADGRRVTGFALRKEIGGGNPNRLKNIWDTYKQSQEVVEAEPVQELPIEVQEALDSVITGIQDQMRALALSLNTKAVKTAERRVSEVVKAAKNEQEKAEAELDDAAQTVEDVEEKLDSALKKIKQLTEQVHQCETTRQQQNATITEQSQQLAVLNEKNTALEKALQQEQDENQARQAEIKRLSDQVDDLKLDKKNINQQYLEQKHKCDELRTDKDVLKTSVKTLEILTAEHEKTIQNLDEKQTQCQEDKQQLDNKLAGMTGKLQRASDEKTTLATKNSELEKYLSEIKTNNNELKEANKTLQQQLIELAKK